MRYHLYVFGILSLLLVAQTAFAAGTGLTYHGRILKPDGTPLESSAVQFTLEIRSPGSEACLLYQETQTINMNDSGGAFSLELGANPTFRVSAAVDGGLSLSKIFGNKGTLTVPNCNFGTSYTPNVADGRILYITFNDGSGAQSLSAQRITFVPFAIEAMQLNGYTASQFLRVDSGTAPALTAANLTTLNDLFNGTLNINTTGTVTSSGAVSGSEMRTSAIKVYNGSNYVQLTAPVLTGNVLFKLPAADGSSGQVLQTDGSGTLSWATPSAGGGGTITAVNVTAPLTNSGTATVPNIGIPMAGGTQSGYLSTADWNTFNNKLNSSDITASLITTTLGYVPVNKAGDTMSGDLTTQNITMAANKYLTLSSNATPGNSAGQMWYDSGTIKYFDGTGVKSVNTSINNLSTALPSGQIWVGNASGGAQAASLAGDINSVSNTGSVVVNKTTTGQSNTILSLDGSGIGTMKGLALNNTGTVTLSAQTASATYGLTLPAAAPTGTQTLQADASGNLTWVSSASLTDSFVKGGNTFGANTTIGLNDGFDLGFETNNTVKMTLTKDGKLGLGTASPGAAFHIMNGRQALEDNSNTNAAAGIAFWKNRNYAATQSGDEHGSISFYGHDGSTTLRSAFILAQGDGAPAAGSVPGSIGFYTTTAGNADSTVKLHIAADGKIGIGTAFPTASLDLSTKKDAIRLPAGTTAEQPSSPAAGMIRYNTSNSGVEYYNGTAWSALGSGGGSFSNITGPGAISITAGGTNQNITLTASGTGVVTSPSVVTLTNTTASTSYSNGALVVSGGVGVSGAINTNSNITAAGTITSAASSIYKANGDAVMLIQSENTSTNTARYPRVDLYNFLGSPSTGSGGNPGINLINYRGTSATTAAMRSGESLGSMIFGGSYNTSGNYYETASIWAQTTENFSSTAAGTSLQFYVTPNGTKVQKQKMTLDQNGFLGLNTATPTEPVHIVEADSSLGLRIENQSSTASRTPGVSIKNYSGTFSGGPTLLFESARGSSSSTSTIKSGDNLGQILFQGLKNGSNYVMGAQIYGQASEDWASGTAGTSLIFSTISSGATSASERMRIEGGTGRVGIGSSSPNNTLQVGSTGSSTTKQGIYVGTYLSTAGMAQYNGNWVNSGYWGLGPATNASDNTILLGNTVDQQGTWNGTQTLNFSVGGKIGVGTIAPIAPLDVRGSRSFEASMVTANTANDGYSGLNLYDDTGANKGLIAYGNSGAAVASSSLIVSTRDATSPIVFGINANEVARISSGGNVGIGTNNPGYKLDVNGIANVTTLRAGNGTFAAPSISFTSSPGVGIWSNGNLNFSNSGLQMTLNSNSLAFNAGGAGPQIYQTGGNAAKPSYAFNVDSDTGMFNPNASGGSNQLGFSTAGIERLRIDENGNVGIGTTTASSPLTLYRDVDDIMTISNSQHSWGFGVGKTTDPGAFFIADYTNGRRVLRITPSDDTTIYGCLVYSTGTLGTCASDQRLKEDIRPFDLGLDKLLGIQPVYYKYNGLGGMEKDSKDRLGVIAQQVEKVAPEIVETRQVKLHPGDTENTEIKVVNYGSFTYMLMNSIKELYNKWFTDHTRIAELEKQNRELKEALCEMNPNSKICTK